MPAYPRREIVPGDEVGVYHCIARCVAAGRFFAESIPPPDSTMNFERTGFAIGSNN